MTLPNPPQSGSDGGYSVEPTSVPPGTVSSPLTPLITEKRGGSPALTLLLGFALVVAVGGVAFAAGRLTAPASAATAGTGARGGNGTGNGFAPGASGAPAGGGFAGAGGLGGNALVTVQGTVQAITPTSISLTLPSGAVVQIPLDPATTYHGQSAATAADVKLGGQVTVELAGGAGGFGGRGQGGANASAPAPVGSPGTAPAASPGASGAPGGGTGVGGALGPARDVTIVTP